MRSRMLALLAAIVVLFTALSASAQSGIFLGPTSTTVVKFLPDGDGNFILNLCAKDGCDHLGGRGSIVGYDGFYAIASATRITGTLISGENCKICQWRMGVGSINFMFTTKPNGQGAVLLTGTFQPITMTQTKDENGFGFNQFLAGNFTPTGGKLLKHFVNNGGAGSLQFTTRKPIQRIRQSLSGRFNGILDPGTSKTH
jgi:hypothetical protein